MNTISVNSNPISDNYARTAVAQQRVTVDRGNILETEAQLSDYQQQLNEDLTYLAKLQRRNHEVQQLEGSQAQTTALDHIDKSVQSFKASFSSAFSTSPVIGTNINIVA